MIDVDSLEKPTQMGTSKVARTANLDEEKYIHGGRVPHRDDFPDDRRPPGKIAESHAFLAFCAKYRKIGLKARRTNVFLSQAVSKHLAGRVENDGGLAIGVLEEDSAAFSAPMVWEAAQFRRRPKFGDVVILTTPRLDEVGTRVTVCIPVSIGFVDRMVEGLVETGRRMPRVVRMREIRAVPGAIGARGGHPLFEVPMALVGFDDVNGQAIDVEMPEGSPEPTMTPLFGMTVSSATTMPSALQLAAAIKEIPALVDTLSPAPSRVAAPSIGAPAQEQKMDSQLNHIPRFQPSPMPVRR